MQEILTGVLSCGTRGTVLARRPPWQGTCTITLTRRAEAVSGRETIMKHQQNHDLCAHKGCHCTRREGSKYCSQYCQDAGSTLELSCNCQHPGCGVEGTFKQEEESRELVSEKA